MSILKFTEFLSLWQQRLMGSIVPSRFKVALKATLLASIVDGKHSVFQVLSSSESYWNVSSLSLL